MDGSKAREQEGDRMADALVDGNGDASWQVDDSDYPDAPLSAEDWLRDAPDYLLPSNIEDSEAFRKLVSDASWYRELLVDWPTASESTRINYHARLANLGLGLLEQLAKSGLTEKQIKGAE